MTRGSVPNFLSNSQQFLRKFGDRIIEASKDKTVNGVLVEGVDYDTTETINRIKKRYGFDDKQALIHFLKHNEFQ